MLTTCSARGIGSRRSAAPFSTEKIPTLIPTPRAIANTAAAVKPGLLRSTRTAKRRSCQQVSTIDSQPAVRTASFETSRFPRSKHTARSASLRLIPCFIFSSAASSKKLFSSSSSSRPTRSFRNSDRSPPAMLRSNDMVRLRRLQDSGDRCHLPSPFSCFAAELFSSLLSQGVIFCSPVILGSSPFASDQSGSLQPLKSDKQGTCIDAENAPTDLFDADSNAPSMHRFQHQRFQNEHVQSALHNITRFVSHKRASPEDQGENTPLLLSVKRRINDRLTDARISWRDKETAREAVRERGLSGSKVSR